MPRMYQHVMHGSQGFHHRQILPMGHLGIIAFDLRQAGASFVEVSDIVEECIQKLSLFILG